MRNAVIRRKALREQAIIRRYLFTPQRFIVPSMEIQNWSKMSQRLWAL